MQVLQLHGSASRQKAEPLNIKTQKLQGLRRFLAAELFAQNRLEINQDILGGNRLSHVTTRQARRRMKVTFSGTGSGQTRSNMFQHVLISLGLSLITFTPKGSMLEQNPNPARHDTPIWHGTRH